MVVTATVGCANSSDTVGYAHRMEAIQRGGMMALGSWGAANVIGNGAILAYGGNSSFATMNLGWAGINLGLAATGLITAPSVSETPQLAELLSRQRSLENAYLFNAGLDVGYLFAGLWLRELALRPERDDQLRGFGTAIVVQGAFLFAFDLVMFLIHSAHGRHLYRRLAG